MVWCIFSKLNISSRRTCHLLCMCSLRSHREAVGLLLPQTQWRGRIKPLQYLTACRSLSRAFSHSSDAGRVWPLFAHRCLLKVTHVDVLSVLCSSCSRASIYDSFGVEFLELGKELDDPHLVVRATHGSATKVRLVFQQCIPLFVHWLVVMLRGGTTVFQHWLHVR